ncbi:MAG: helix-turn-helix domain-containing protein [Archangium sp.]
MTKPLNARRFTSALVPYVLTFVRMSGRDPSSLEKKYLRGTSTPEVSLHELGGILGDAAKLLGDDLFGLHAAMGMSRGGYGLLEFGLRSAPTGRVAMEQLATFGALINPLVRWSLEVDGDDVSLHHRAPQKGGVGKQGNTFTVVRILQIAREMMGDDVKPIRAWFAHSERSCPAELQKFLGTANIDFGRASNGITFSAKTLERVPAGADVALNQALELHGRAVLERCGAELEDAWSRARGAVLELLPRGDVTLTRVAKKLHVTPRTLQRRLEEHGSSFAGLLAEVRRSHAERLLQRSDEPIAEVANKVGYADAATFVRAFKTWTGTTPGQFRTRTLA